MDGLVHEGFLDRWKGWMVVCLAVGGDACQGSMNSPQPTPTTERKNNKVKPQQQNCRLNADQCAEMYKTYETLDIQTTYRKGLLAVLKFSHHLPQVTIPLVGDVSAIILGWTIVPRPLHSMRMLAWCSNSDSKGDV
eukprot:792021-Amphidinium_carterae.1